MSISVKLRELVGSVPALTVLSRAKLPGPIVFRLAKAIRMIQVELDAYEQVRVDLVRFYGKPNETGETQVTPANLSEFQSDIAALLESDVTLAFDALPLSIISGLNFSAEEIGNVLFMFADATETA